VQDQDPRKRGSPIKEQMAGWLACFRAMRTWPKVDPEELSCPTMLVVGTKNENAMKWVNENREELARSEVALRIIDGLTHNQEFTEINQVFSIISQFLKQTLIFPK
jgi:hypothetical protein